MNDKPKFGLKSSAFAALALAFASFGDAFLYPFLPLNFHTVGIPALWVGLVLSVNRFVRILSNTLMVHTFSRYGLRSVMMVATALGIASTFGYGLANGVVTWLVFRIAWGLSFSAMRIGTLGYALQLQDRGLAFGVSRGLQEAGPMLSLLMAPVLVKYFDSTEIFYFLSLLSLPALYFAWALPVKEDKTQIVESAGFLRWPSTLNLITFVSAVVIDGIIVIVLGMLFLHHRGHINLETATGLAACYLGYRRICSVGLSAAGGWVSDRLGIERIFNVSLALVVLGLLVIISGWIGTGAVIVFTFYCVHAAIAPGPASRSSHPLAAIAVNTTWRDFGAAIGTLLGGVLISSSYLNTVLMIAVLIMVSLLLTNVGPARKAFKMFYLWK